MAKITRVTNKNLDVDNEDKDNVGEPEMDNQQKSAEEFRDENSDMFIGTTNEMWHGDLLGRYLGCKVIESDAQMPWDEENTDRFGGISYVEFTRLYPEKKILIDLFESSAADDEEFLATVEKTKRDKRIMCAKRGYKYIGAVEDIAVNYEEIEKQLRESEKLIKKFTSESVKEQE